MRVVSLTCSNTEIVHFLGKSDVLVGVDDHSDWPASVVEQCARVGPDLGVDADKVAALRPDLVLASRTVPGHEKVVERLERAGLPLLVLEPKSLADVACDIVRIGDALDAGRAARRLSEQFSERLRIESPAEEPKALRSDRKDDRRPSVLVQWWPKPVITPGRLSWVQGLIERAGAVNPLADEAVESRPLTDGEVAEFDPDIIVVSWCGVEAHKVRPDVVVQNPEFAEVAAVRNDRVVCIPEAWLGRPSPRLAWGLWALEQVLGGDSERRFVSAESSAHCLAQESGWPPRG